MGIIAFIILGLLAGLIAKALLPGNDPGGLIITTIIGIVGALLGGFLAAALFDAHPLDEFFDISTWITAIVGSIILLAIYRAVMNRGGQHRTGVAVDESLDGEAGLHVHRLAVDADLHRHKRPLPSQGCGRDLLRRRVPFAGITQSRFEGSRAAPGSQESSPHGDGVEYTRGVAPVQH